MKQTLFERSARAPLIVAGPRIPSKGRSTSRVVESWTSTPRSPSWRAFAHPGLHGRSLMPLLKNPGAEMGSPALTQVRRGPAASAYMA